MTPDSVKNPTGISYVVKNDEKLGLWYGRRVGKIGSWVVALALVMGSIRGFMVINLDVPPKPLYMLTAVALLSLAAYGWALARSFRHPDFVWLKNLLKLSILLGAIHIIIGYVIGAHFNVSLLYLFLAPYIIFLFLRIPTSYFNIAVIVITIAIGCSLIGNFLEALKGPEGWENVFAYNDKLRPEEGASTLGKSRTGDFYRASGYTGNPHDSANILGMVASFLFVRFFVKRKILDLGLFLFALLSLSLTQSASNIIATIFTLAMFGGYILIKKRSLSVYIYFCFALLGVSILIATFGDVMSIFTARLGSEGDWVGMTQQLGIGDLLSGVPHILVGHAAGFNSPVVSVEIAFLKMIFQFGIVHAFILFGILLYPHFKLFRSGVPIFDALPSAAALFFGFMSLLHYGSVFRVTSVFLFFMFFAMCMNHIIVAKERRLYGLKLGRA